MRSIQIQVDQKQRELSEHGTPQFPLEINHDVLDDFDEHAIRCHWHEELEIPVVVQGAVCCQLKDQTFELNAGEGLVINSRVPHSIRTRGSGEPVLLTTIFHPSLLYDSPSSAAYQKLLCPYLNAAELAGLPLPAEGVVRMAEIDAVYEKAPFGYELQIKGLLCTLFFELLSGRREQLASARPVGTQALSRLGSLLDLLHERYAEPLSLAQLAAQTGLSREGCCRLFKSMTGKTILQYLEDYRVTQGVRLLQEEAYSITEVAYLVGFGNPGRFSAAFARRMHCTPSQFRKGLCPSDDAPPCSARNGE